ncbi:reverse transcriptase domain protein [Colletotrichum incanum]|nr:reverse transcriptase domain protein [Colletotrichum incanum]
MSLESSTIISTTRKLRSPSDWPSWYLALQLEARSKHVWEFMDPDGPVKNNDGNFYPDGIPDSFKVFTIDEYVADENAKRNERNTKRDEAYQEPLLAMEDPNVKITYQTYLTNASTQETIRKRREKAFDVIDVWVKATVSDTLLLPAQMEALERNQTSLRSILRILKRQHALSNSTSQTLVREEYLAVMDRANSSISPTTWLAEWRHAYLRAVVTKAPEVQGTLASQGFLRAVSRRIAPSWATRELSEIVRNEQTGLPTPDPDFYATLLSGILQEDTFATKQRGRTHGVYTTLAGRPAQSTDNELHRSAIKDSHESCPCSRDHHWSPLDCGYVEKALTGTTVKNVMVDEEFARRICNRINDAKNSELRIDLVRKGWLRAVPSLRRKGNNKNSHPNKSNNRPRDNRTNTMDSKKPDTDLPSKIVACIINPALFQLNSSEAEPGPRSYNVFATPYSGPHVLSRSTVLDNCGATHLVNDLTLLEPDLIKIPDGTEDRVDSGTASYPIIAKGRRVIKAALKNRNGATMDLTLEDVGYVENFHVNVVSEALLRKTGIWYSGLDCTLRYGGYEDGFVVKQLTRMANIAFLEYKPLSSYLSSTRIPVSDAALVNFNATIPFPSITPKRPSYHEKTTRNDPAWLWHLRGGHLGPEALEHLVSNVRGVKMKAYKRIDCSHCQTAHAQKVISRRRSERRSFRPYYRIAWDLFDYPVAFDNNSWLMVIKDEYTGRLFGFPRLTKTHESVFKVLRVFERWVARQRGLAVCKIRQDVDRSVIAINGYTDFQQWAQNEGIEVETTPPHTKEPNGGAERAGQEAITRGIKMLSGANLPHELWVEAVMAGIFLYNISPRKNSAWLTPIEKEERWFRQYFRWWQPHYQATLGRDLRPQWGWLHAYGCRAYPVRRDRERDVGRRRFKVELRGHIGYLVGYVQNAHNLYRIWIPSLKQVIITRNVTFDESRFYSKDDAKEGISGEEARAVADDIQHPSTSHEPEFHVLGITEEIDVKLILQNEHPSQQLQPPGPALRTVVSDEGKSGDDNPDRIWRGGWLLTPDPTPDPGDVQDQQLEAVTPVSEPTQGDEPVSNPREVDHQHEVIEDEIIVRTSPVPNENPETTEETTTRLGSAPASRIGQGQGRDVSDQDGPDGNAPSRQSRRLQGLPPDSVTNDQSQPKTANFLSMFAHSRRTWDAFFNTFMPDRQKAVDEKATGHRTIHSYVQATIIQPKHVRKAPLRTEKMRTAKLPPPPNNWREFLRLPPAIRDQFMEAMVVEIRKLEQMGAWKVVDRSDVGVNPILLKWVWTYKGDQDGFLDRYKARICVRGDMQEEDPLEQTYAATLAARTFRVVMAIAAEFDLEIHQFDVVNAFLNAERGPNEPPIVCYLPDGFKISGKVVELRRALYGLRDAPLLWYREFSGTLRRLGMEPTAEDPCLFQTPDKKVLLIFYVDDILVLYHKNHADIATSIMGGIKATYEVKDQGSAEWYLGIRILRDRLARKIYLAHDTYIERIASKFNLVDSRTPTIPLPTITLEKNDSQATPDEVRRFQEKIGSILYTAIMIRPDVAYACALLSRFLTNPSKAHHRAADQVIRYLYHTRYLAICYGTSGGAQVLLIASDASFADDEETRRSSQGYIISLYEGPIQWKAARQSTVTTSTTEAELLSLEHVAKETIALQRLFRDVQLDLGDVWKIYCDNNQTIRLVIGEKERILTRLRHVDIQNLWLRQEFAKRTFDVVYLPTDEMPADGLTKSLTRAKFEQFRALLNLQDTRTMIKHVGKVMSAKEECPQAV